MIPGVAGLHARRRDDRLRRRRHRPARAARRRRRGHAVHLCAGAGAMPLGELLDITYDALGAATPAWRRGASRSLGRPISRPGDVFAVRAHDRGDGARAAATRDAVRSSHFVPQLALPKRFDTPNADALLGAARRRCATSGAAMLDHLQRTGWRGVPGLAEGRMSAPIDHATFVCATVRVAQRDASLPPASRSTPTRRSSPTGSSTPCASSSSSRGPSARSDATIPDARSAWTTSRRCGAHRRRRSRPTEEATMRQR